MPGSQVKPPKMLLAIAITCAMAFSTLLATETFALECKSSPIVANSKGSYKTKAEAMESAKLNWVDKVWKKYGPYWHNLGISQEQSSSCKDTRGGIACSFSARPCRSHS